MKNRWLDLLNVALVVFACLVVGWQIGHRRDKEGIGSIVQSYRRAGQLAQIGDIVERDRALHLTAAVGRHLDLILPKDARVFMPGMTGRTNVADAGVYFFLTYYLFPREVAVSVGQPARLTKDGFLGAGSWSDDQLRTNGFDVVAELRSDGGLNVRLLRGGFASAAANPVWFPARLDAAIAFLLPLLTALAGRWLLRLIFFPLSPQMPWLEQVACGLSLGMMAVAALTLGAKLCGIQPHRLVLLITAACAAAESWRERKTVWRALSGGSWRILSNPAIIAGLAVFLILFRLAALQGLLEYDAVAGWALKAKLIHLCTGHDLIRWFSEPRLAHAHLDYPTLVPALHAATYDSLGHVDEFVTKFWPTWMLLLLLAALASRFVGASGGGWRVAPSCLLLALLLLPATQQYAQWEGGTMPMVFFTVLGLVQCQCRPGLGLTLLFGAAMSKFEGAIFLAATGGWLLLLPGCRRALAPSFASWRAFAFCFLAALPFLWLRLNIQVLHYASHWAHYALEQPATTLAHWPTIFRILVSRWFVNPSFGNWSAVDDHLRWSGQWEGLSSLYSPSTLGLGWLCLLMTVAIWFGIPARRKLLLWLLAVILTSLAAFSIVFSSFLAIENLSDVLGFTGEDAAFRYLFPLLIGWSAVMMTMIFGDPSQPRVLTKPVGKEKGSKRDVETGLGG